MDVCGVAGTFTEMKQQQLQADIGTRVLKMSLDNQSQMAQDLMSLMSSATISPPHLGRNIDVRF